jgi:hypothetical protein
MSACSTECCLRTLRSCSQWSAMRWSVRHASEWVLTIAGLMPGGAHLWPFPAAATDQCCFNTICSLLICMCLSSCQKPCVFSDPPSLLGLQEVRAHVQVSAQGPVHHTRGQGACFPHPQELAGAQCAAHMCNRRGEHRHDGGPGGAGGRDTCQVGGCVCCWTCITAKTLVLFLHAPSKSRM